MTLAGLVLSRRVGVSRRWRRSAIATLTVTLAVFVGSGAVLADPGDLVFRRMSGFSGEDQWGTVAVYGSGVYVGGLHRQAGVLRRYSRSGDLVWTRALVGVDGGFAIIFGVAADSSGVYVTGYRDIGSGAQQAFLAHYHFGGTRDWLEPIDVGPDSDAVAIDTFGSYVYVTGTYEAPAGDDQRTAYASKYTRDGVEVWTRRMAADPDQGVTWVSPVGIAASADGVYLAGSEYQGDPGHWEIFVRMYDLEGDHPRTSTRSMGLQLNATGVAADSSGAYVIAQTEIADETYGGLPGGSFLFKFDDTDSYQWHRRITARSSTEAFGVAVTSNGVWITGRAFDRLTNQPGTSRDDRGDVFLVRYTHGGQPRLTYQYSQPGDQNGWAVAADYAGVYIAGSAGRFGTKRATDRLDGLLLSAELP